MKRLCIYVTYDCENVVDDYVGYMLHELRKVADCLIVVCNYRHIEKGIENIQPYADKIYNRENIGFDAGAYKDALCKYLGWDEVYRYDELLLVNDSFYGPLYPIEDMFNTMKNLDTDYWGIIRAPEGIFDDGYLYDTHIQSYFWVFRKNVLESGCFRRFWEELAYPNTLYQAVLEFELGCNRYLTKHGFKGTALTDICQISHLFKGNEIPYLQYSLEMIRDANIPIIKRRSLYFGNRGFGNALEALKYIEDKCAYDVRLIKKHLTRISQSMKNQGMMNFLKLQRFYDEHSKIYFYGAGVYGQNLARYFTYMGWSFDGFLVTNLVNQSETCIAFDDVRLSDDDGIIIAVGNPKAACEIFNTIQKRCNVNQIFYPNYVIKTQ